MKAAYSRPDTDSNRYCGINFNNFFVRTGVAVARLTPRIAVAGLAGFYILGYAYANGWMAAIDQLAMKVMRHYNMGYVAIGALMPTVQWYAAWGVRVSAALAAGLAYDLLERVVILAASYFTSSHKSERAVPVLPPAFRMVTA